MTDKDFDLEEIKRKAIEALPEDQKKYADEQWKAAQGII